MDFTDFLVSHNSSLDVNGVSLLQNKQSQILPRNCFSITSFLNIVYEDSKYLLLYQGLSGVAPILSAQHILIRGRSRLLFKLCYMYFSLVPKSDRRSLRWRLAFQASILMPPKENTSRSYPTILHRQVLSILNNLLARKKTIRR